MFRGREQMVIDLKTRFLFGAAIGAAKVRKEIELRFCAGFQRGTHLYDVQPGDHCGHFAVRLNDLGHPVGVCMLQRRHQLGRR